MTQFVRATGIFLLLLPVFAAAAADTAERQGPAAAPATDYSAVIGQLEELITHEMRATRLPALSIALVDDQRIVWADGFGMERAQEGIPATADTVYRVGSVSKLFTDIAVMQLVEEGALDLDAPITRYLPEFHPHDPYEGQITLRQLMSHASGLVREPPVGHYFDATEPSLAATVRSLNRTTLVYPPGTKTKYSNAGIAAVGYVLEKVQGEPFARYLQRAVLEPMGMRHSAFAPQPELERHLAAGYMWTYDGRRFPAPTFELGMAPAGSLYTTVKDLGRFLSVLFADGRGPGGRVLRPETLESMWQLEPGADSGYGIGFFVSELAGRRKVGHGGAIYGYATQLAALPDEKLGAIVVASLDMTNEVAGRIADTALRGMLARASDALPELRLPGAVPPDLAARLEGRYGRGAAAVELEERDGRLFLWPLNGGTRAELKFLDGTLIAAGRLGDGFELIAKENAVVIGGSTLERIEPQKPQPVPERWQGLIGEYGWDYDTLYILEKDGQLCALIEWFFLYPLEKISEGRFRFPDQSLYAGEELVFTRDANGRATEADIGGVVFERRAVGPGSGDVFRISPVRPVDELRADAMAAEPPREAGDFRAPDLVPLRRLDPTIKLDIRYAGTDNFMSAAFYEEPRALLQRPAAEALVRAHRALKEKGYGLLIHDAYRPWAVTRMFWDATPADKKQFVANPADGSRHNRGAAVDLTLYDLATGEPVEMVSGYDEFSPRAYPGYPGGTSLQRWHRELLRETMEAQRFSMYEWEWWHFDYKDWRHYPILNLTFDEVARMLLPHSRLHPSSGTPQVASSAD